MNEQDCLESLKTMLSEAIMFGTKLSQHNYSYDLQDEKGRFIKDEFDRLYLSTKKFLQASGLNNLSEQQIFPLYEEIQNIARK